MGEFASKSTAGTALGLSIGALGVEALNGGIGRLFGSVGFGNAPVNQSADANAAAAIAAMMAAATAGGKTCSEDHTVNRYEAQKDARIAELETEVKLRDANIYTDEKILKVYEYFDGEIKDIRKTLCDQSVWNATQTATISCMAQQIAQLQSLTKIVIPNGSVCPGWGTVKVVPESASAAA